MCVAVIVEVFLGQSTEQGPSWGTEIATDFKIFSESDYTHNELQKDEYEDVKEDIKIVKCGRGE